MKVSGRKVAKAIGKKLAQEIKEKNLKPKLAIILAGSDKSSKVYVKNKIKTAKRIGVEVKLYEFSKNELDKCITTIQKLDKDQSVHGIIVQHPIYDGWNFDQIVSSIDPQKDVDGFLENSPYSGAAALAVWEMLTAFAFISEFEETSDFLKNKKIVVIGLGKTAGGPTVELLEKKGYKVASVVKETKNPTPIIKKADIVISATGVKNIVNKNNLKKGAYVIGVGVGKEVVDGEEKIYGDIKEDEVSKIAKLYCPTIGGIGPLTIISLLKNVVESAKKAGK